MGYDVQHAIRFGAAGGPHSYRTTAHSGTHPRRGLFYLFVFHRVASLLLECRALLPGRHYLSSLPSRDKFAAISARVHTPATFGMVSSALAPAVRISPFSSSWAEPTRLQDSDLCDLYREYGRSVCAGCRIAPPAFGRGYRY